MKLNDTISHMTSNNYAERLIGEYEQIVIREEGLSNMLEKWDRNELAFSPNSPKSVFKSQLNAMKSYRAALETRAYYEHIELPSMESILA